MRQDTELLPKTFWEEFFHLESFCSSILNSIDAQPVEQKFSVVPDNDQDMNLKIYWKIMYIRVIVKVLIMKFNMFVKFPILPCDNVL